jgi:predicted Fe-S protein YdhL (DUF1289 family)
MSLAEPLSPCTSVCKIDPARGLCWGCLRTLHEIAQWSSYTREEKTALLAVLATRRPAPPG